MKSPQKCAQEMIDGYKASSYSFFVKHTPKYESIPGFLFSFAYPVQLWAFFKWTEQRQTYRVLLLFTCIALSVFGIAYNLPSILQLFGATVTWSPLKQYAIGSLSVVVLNLILFMILITFDLPALFTTTGRIAVWEWENQIMGHKLWSGANTHDLLQWLVTDDAKLGRAKWLLVNFLADDIEYRIERHGNQVLYELSVNGWPTIWYSEFLARNMTHATESILWVVDPRDLIRDILPAHIFEVLISICSCLDDNVLSNIERAANASEENPENLRALLTKDYSQFCPLRFFEQCADRDDCALPAPTKLCPQGLSFHGNKSQKHYEHLWFSFFLAALNKLSAMSATSTGDTLKIGSKNLRFKQIREAYTKRESKVGSLVLPHIDEFRKASCNKRRHIYLGMRPAGTEVPKDKAAENIKKLFTVSDKYIDAVFPRLSSDSGYHSLFDSYVQLQQSGPQQHVVSLDSASRQTEWETIHDDVKRLLLDWAIDLFSSTSGGKRCISGVFFKHEPDQHSYHDIGIYDRKLEVSSIPGNGRKVVWRVFAERSPLYDKYFPVESELVLPFREVKNALKDALSG